MTNEPQPVEHPIVAAVAVWSGIALTLPNGRVLPFLFCSAATDTSGFFVEGAKPSNEDEDMVRCQHCQAPHYVVSLPDALEEGFINLEEAGCPSIMLEHLLAVMIRGGAAERADS